MQDPPCDSPLMSPDIAPVRVVGAEVQVPWESDTTPLGGIYRTWASLQLPWLVSLDSETLQSPCCGLVPTPSSSAEGRGVAPWAPPRPGWDAQASPTHGPIVHRHRHHHARRGAVAAKRLGVMDGKPVSYYLHTPSTAP